MSVLEGIAREKNAALIYNMKISHTSNSSKSKHVSSTKECPAESRSTHM